MFFECPALTYLANVDFRHILNCRTIINGFHSKSFWQGDGGGYWLLIMYHASWYGSVKLSYEKSSHFHTDAGMLLKNPKSSSYRLIAESSKQLIPNTFNL